jgi:nitrous oxide reductase accessory protein NosL
MSVLKAYCQECGMAHSYTLHKPNFCQACGAAMGKGEKPKANAVAEASVEPPEFSVDSMDGLAFEHEPNPTNKLTIKDLIDQNEGGVSSSHAPNQSSNLSSEEVLAQLQKESSSIRGPKPPK